MTDTVTTITALPEILFKLIKTENVRVKETSGDIRLIPIKGKVKRPRAEARGILRDKVWMSDDFNAPLDEMMEYME